MLTQWNANSWHVRNVKRSRKRHAVILSGRRINDGMGAYVGEHVIRLLAGYDLPIRQARVAILGFAFKENVPDIRNSKVIDI